MGVMTRLIECRVKDLINVAGRLGSKNFEGMLTCFLGGITCAY